MTLKTGETISRTDQVDGRFILASDTPRDGRSTYSECWGANHHASARAVYGSDNLNDVVAVATRWPRSVKIVDRETKRIVRSTR